MQIRLAIAVVAVLTGVLWPAWAGHADQGVGVNLGSIQVEQVLRPGGSYGLPALGVLNSGDEPGQYVVAITYDEHQARLQPREGWFSIQPQTFRLAPGETRSVDIRLDLPTGAGPGDYFAYIEARPVDDGEGVRVNIAAATRLSFTVEPASWLDAQRRRVERFLRDNQPWTSLLPLAAVAGFAFAWCSRRVRFRLPFEPR